jgi:hypothetical protein
LHLPCRRGLDARSISAVKFRIPDLMQIASRVMEHNRQAEPSRARNAGCMTLFLKKTERDA